MYRRFDDVPQRVHSVVGSRIKQLYKPRYDDAGMMYLEHAGELDAYAEIQSHKDSVDIHVLLARYQNGDVTALQRVQGVFGDFTQLPKTYADALNLVNDGKQLFDELPVDVRAKFGHDFARFVASIGTPEFMAVFGGNQVSSDSESAEVKKEVTDVES